MSPVHEIIRRLLGREPESTDGFAETELTAAENATNLAIPPALRMFYHLAGRSDMLVEAFNQFALPEQLAVTDGKVFFLEENQGVCLWGFDPGETNPMVFMQPAGTAEWYPEMHLDAFLAMVLYYQCAQGGYEPCGSVGLDDEQLAPLLEKEWETVVKANGLFIAWKPDCLLWYLFDEKNGIIDEIIYFSARTDAAYAAHEETYDLVEL